MIRSSTASAFSVGELWADASSVTRHSLSMAHLDTKTVGRLKKMLDVSGLRYHSPIWRRDAWAHIGLLNQRIAFLVQVTSDRHREEKFRAAWLTYGWKLMAISERSLERLTDEQMAEQFLAAVKVLRRTK